MLSSSPSVMNSGNSFNSLPKYSLTMAVLIQLSATRKRPYSVNVLAESMASACFVSGIATTNKKGRLSDPVRTE
ncbi:hypothetical protein D3C72_1938950 [compost metagenome]